MYRTLGDIRKALGVPPATPLAPLYGGDASNLVTPVTPERAVFNELLRKYSEAPDDLSIMRGAIRSEAVLSTTQGTQAIIFNVRADQPNPTNPIRTTEIRLQTRDSFCADLMTVQFGIETATAPVPSQLVPQNWPNSAGQGVGGFGTNFQGVQQAYNGTLSGVVNSVQYLRNLDMDNFVYADYAQRGTLLFTASNQVYNNMQGNRGYLPLTPNMDIKGSDTTQFTVNMPDAFTFSLSTFQQVAIFRLRGFYIQGGAQYLMG